MRSSRGAPARTCEAAHERRAQPLQRPRDASAARRRRRRPAARIAAQRARRVLRAGDLVVANDAATLPASLAGMHLRERRADRAAAGRTALARSRRRARVHRRRLRRRRLPHAHRRPAAPPPLAPATGWPSGRCARRSLRTARPSAPGRAALRWHADAIWEGIARHGQPIQYAHLAEPLALWDVGRAIAARRCVRAAFGRLRPRLAAACRAPRRGVGFATLTHAAGLSSTGDAGSTRGCRSTNPTDIPDGDRAGDRQTRRRAAASSRSAPRSFERSSMRRPAAAGCAPATAWRLSASARQPAPHRRCDLTAAEPAAATTSCCERSQTGAGARGC